LISSFNVIIWYHPTQAFNRTKGKCANKCWIDFLLLRTWKRHMLGM